MIVVALLFWAVNWVLGKVTPADGQELAFWLINNLLSLVQTTAFAVLAAVTYVRLRAVRDGVTADSLATELN